MTVGSRQGLLVGRKKRQKGDAVPGDCSACLWPCESHPFVYKTSTTTSLTSTSQSLSAASSLLPLSPDCQTESLRYEMESFPQFVRAAPQMPPYAPHTCLHSNPALVILTAVFQHVCSPFPQALTGPIMSSTCRRSPQAGGSSVPLLGQLQLGLHLIPRLGSGGRSSVLLRMWSWLKFY